MTTQIKTLIIVGIVTAVGVGAYLFSADSTTTTNTASTVQLPVGTTPETEPNDETSPPQKLTLDAVAEHNKENDCWTIINGSVYDITEYVPRHPGGDEILLACGTDGTTLFTSRTTNEGETIGSGTPHSSNASRQLESYLIGTLEQ